MAYVGTVCSASSAGGISVVRPGLRTLAYWLHLPGVVLSSFTKSVHFQPCQKSKYPPAIRLISQNSYSISGSVMECQLTCSFLSPPAVHGQPVGLLLHNSRPRTGPQPGVQPRQWPLHLQQVYLHHECIGQVCVLSTPALHCGMRGPVMCRNEALVIPAFQFHCCCFEHLAHCHPLVGRPCSARAAAMTLRH